MTMVSYQEALAAVLEHAPLLPAERVEVARSLSRALAEDVTAPRDLPWRDTSLMDGYAVRASGAQAGAALAVTMALPPGARPERPLGPGEAARIMTGGPLPEGADAVVMQEHTRAEGDRVVLERAAQAGEHVRRRGDEVRSGEVVLTPGTEIGPAELALLVSLGRTHVSVGGRPRVAIGTSGDELDEAPGDPREGRTIESNTPTLSALTSRAGGEPWRLGIAPDTLAGVSALVARAGPAEVLVTCGGASVGPHDHTLEALEAAGARMIFRRVAIKPGRPTALAMWQHRPAIALPGNPAAALIGFELFVRPLLRRMQGFRDAARTPWICELAEPVARMPELTGLLRGRMEQRGARLVFVPGPRQGSMQIRSLVGQAALAVVPPGSGRLTPGDVVEVLSPFM